MRELAELLLDAPAGIKLYCPAWGEVVFQGISDDINVLTDKGEFDGYGRMDPNGECLLFPSKDRHDWEEWQEDLFRPNDVVSCDEGVMSSPAMRGSSSTWAPSTTTSYQPIT